MQKIISSENETFHANQPYHPPSHAEVFHVFSFHNILQTKKKKKIKKKKKNNERKEKVMCIS
jgi:hypothetical protein